MLREMRVSRLIYDTVEPTHKEYNRSGKCASESHNAVVELCS